MPRFLGILFRPQVTWQSLRDTPASWISPLARHALPLTLLPALAWPAGRFLEGRATVESIPAAFVATVVFSLVSILLFAAGLYLLAPMFRSTRSWSRSVTVSCYSATPVLLAGALLFNPLLVIASIGCFLYAIGLAVGGLQILLDCRDAESAGYLASAAMFLGVTSMAVGALCSAIGLI